MKKLIICLSIVLIAFLGASSCNNNPGKQGEFQKIKTAAEAREYAAKELVQGAPDTLFLDYHWGMTKSEVNSLTQKYYKEKKLRNWFDITQYDLTLEGIGTIETVVSFNYYKDTLSAINISTYDDKVSVLHYLYAFSQTFLDKGYSMFNEDEEPYTHQPAIEFYKGNTSVTLGTYEKIYTTICYRNEYYVRLAKEEKIADMLKEQEVIKEQAAKTKNDF